MKTSHNRNAFLTAAVMFALAGCGGRAGEQQVDGSGSCVPGDTRECVGPGACPGGQQCNDEGHWGLCACAAGGSAGQGQGKGGAGSAGNAGRGPSAGTGHGAAGNGGAGGTTARGGSNSGGTNSSAKGGATPIGSGGYPYGGATGGGYGKGGYSAGGYASGGYSAGGYASGGYSAGGDSAGGYASGGYSAGGAANQPPQITSISFSLNTVTTDDTLWVYPQAFDPESNPIRFSYAWTCNGVPVGADSSYLSGLTYFSRGDSLQVTVTPSDRGSSGAAFTSAPIVVANAPPRFDTETSLTPSGYADDGVPLVCQAGATDPDGDPVTYTYTWFNNGSETTQSGATVPAAVTAVGDTWFCRVTASDGSVSAQSNGSGSADIVNEAKGILRSDTTWVAAKSPYCVTDRIQIAAGVTLTIEPGVTVVANGNMLESWGNIAMLGTKDKPIHIEYLNLYDRSTAQAPGKVTLSYVEFDGGSLLGSATNAVTTVTDSVFRYLQETIFLESEVGATHRIERNVFYFGYGIYGSSPLVLNNNVFALSQTYYSDVTVEDSLVANFNSFLSNTETTVVLGTKAADLRNNYWGGILDSDVPSHIFDNNDDLSIQGVGTYLPTLDAAHPDTPSVDKTYSP